MQEGFAGEHKVTLSALSLCIIQRVDVVERSKKIGHCLISES